jgi:carbamoyltransferase
MNNTNAGLTVLGVNAVYHESSVAIVVDGKLLFAIEEERLNRVKHAKPANLDNPHLLPHLAINECLAKAGITLGQVDVIAVSFNPIKRLVRHRNLNEACEPEGWGTEIGEQKYFDRIMTIPRQLTEQGFVGQFMWVDHEMAHAASAFYPSGFDEAAIISIDGIGEFESASLGEGKNRSITFNSVVDYPNSIGFLWEKFSKFLGFSEYDACKVMSVASFGNPEVYAKTFEDLARISGNGFVLDAKTLNFRFEDYSALESLFNIKKRNSNDQLLEVHYNIAAALQQTTTKILLHLCETVYAKTKSKNLCMAGGVALNCVANTILFEQGPFENIYIQPAANDAGTALGCAFYAYNLIMQPESIKNQKQEHTYLGSSFDNNQILTEIKSANAFYLKLDNIEVEVAKLITQGKVIGWFQGAMEFGPRALGNRSLLADPRNVDMVRYLNVLVKHREDHRPFCPSVLTEHANEWFNIKKEAEASRYMLMAYPVRKDKIDKIPAVVHVDGTSRIQRVDAQTNPKYHRLISEFYKLTGVPVVLNTSFNDREPVVCTPKDAIKTVLRTNIDYLAIGDYLVAKDQASLDTFKLEIAVQL